MNLHLEYTLSNHIEVLQILRKINSVFFFNFRFSCYAGTFKKKFEVISLIHSAESYRGLKNIEENQLRFFFEILDFLVLPGIPVIFSIYY